MAGIEKNGFFVSGVLSAIMVIFVLIYGARLIGIAARAINCKEWELYLHFEASNLLLCQHLCFSVAAQPCEIQPNL